MPQSCRYETYIFDLDNTLYASASKLFSQIDGNMTSFVQKHFDLPFDQAQALQKKYFEDHGTTLYGLMKKHDVNPHHFLDYIHDHVDYTWLSPDAELKAALDALEGKKIVFTNASHHHADRVLDRLGIASCFSGCFDIIDAGFAPKPHRETYEKVLSVFDVDPTRAVMFDDIPKNLVTASQVGMATVLILHDDEGLPYRYDHGDHGPFVDDKTRDLAQWLHHHQSIISQIPSEKKAFSAP